MGVSRRRLTIGLCLAAVVGCSSERKLSHVETREPAAASARMDTSVSPLRARLGEPGYIAAGCPTSVRELLPALALERVKYPPCPEALARAYRDARAVISVNETAELEEFMSAQCRVRAHDSLADSLAALLDEREHKRPGRDEPPAPPEVEAKLRSALRNALFDARSASAPIEQWVRNNGEFVLSEEQLDFFDRLVAKGACRMSDHEVDASYRSIRSLEELAREQPEAEPQRTRLEKFLDGVHRIIERKIREYFR